MYMSMFLYMCVWGCGCVHARSFLSVNVCPSGRFCADHSTPPPLSLTPPTPKHHPRPQITYWDAYDGQTIRIIDGSDNDGVNSLATDRDGEAIVSGGGDKLVRVWGYDEGHCYYVGMAHSGVCEGGSGCKCVCMCVDVCVCVCAWMWVGVG